MESRINPTGFRRKQLITSIVTPAIPLGLSQVHGAERDPSKGWMELVGMIAKPLSIIYQPYPGQPGKSQANGDLVIWCVSLRSVRRSIKRTASLSAWPWCHGSWWSRSCWVQSCSIHRTTGWSGLAGMSSWKAGPAWQTWSPTMTRQPSGWWKGFGCSLHGFSKAIDSLPQYSSRETGIPWLGQVYSSLDKELGEWPGPKRGGWMELNPAGDQSLAIFFSSQYCGWLC